MRKKLLIAAAAIVAVLAVFAAVVAMQPAEFRVARSAIIFAPTPDVFAQVNDFHNWEAWSPWAKLDPAAKVSFAGSPAGEGAVFNWSGNRKVGEGRMTLIESKPSERIRIRLEFVKPMQGTSIAEFTFIAQGERTAVTWSMTGRNGFIAKAVCLVMNMDKMIGGDFEQGLVNLRAVAEAARKT
jgi:hypothetical protein